MDEFEERFSKILNPQVETIIAGEEGKNAAAVLILLVKDENDWKIVYTRRTNGVRTHQGEVSFPGGAYEVEDKTMVKTALRETFEEIGILPACIKIIGGLERVRTISNFLVFPFVGILECTPEFKINPDEVERLFMIPLSWLENRDNFYMQDHLVEDRFVRKVIHYHNYEGEHLWGLTARITQQVLGIE